MLNRINPDQFDLTHIDIIGRGPSVDSYVPRKGAFVICCHYPIVDCDAIGTQHYGEYGFYAVPYITVNDNAVNTVVLPKAILIRDWTILIDHRVYNQPGLHYNTGQMVYLWSRYQKPKSIHLWGFDSIFSENTTLAHNNQEKIKAIEHYRMKEIQPEHQTQGTHSTNRIWKKMLDSSITTIHKGE